MRRTAFPGPVLLLPSLTNVTRKSFSSLSFRKNICIVTLEEFQSLSIPFNPLNILNQKKICFKTRLLHICSRQDYHTFAEEKLTTTHLLKTRLSQSGYAIIHTHQHINNFSLQVQTRRTLTTCYFRFASSTKGQFFAGRWTPYTPPLASSGMPISAPPPPGTLDL
jgi:hypothetical protein